MVLVSGFLNVLLGVLATVLVSIVSCETTPIVVDETSPMVDVNCSVLCTSLLPAVEPVLSSSRVAASGAELVIIGVVDTGFIVVMADVVTEISVDELTSS